MSTSSILSSVLSGSTSVSQTLLELKNSSTSTLLSSLGTSSTSSAAANLTQLVCSRANDSCLVSGISKSLSSIASVAAKSGVSDLMDNVRDFALSMKSDGVDSVTILKYLTEVRELAASDPESFRKVFADSSDTESTISALTDT
ncbi:MAG: hypothetical protein LLG06_01020 [Desulfobacteraceae bacterium]|nr:hypothetical protein [Desulfobacteraceae bacterium]